MERNEFSYKLPDDFNEQLIKYCMLNNCSNLVDPLKHSKIEYKNIGFANYAALTGSRYWDKEALDCTIWGGSKNNDILKSHEASLRDAITKNLHEPKTGLVLRRIEFVVSDDNRVEFSLPNENEEVFETLSNDIRDALNKNEPSLALDRLHTFSTKNIRKICQKHGIECSSSTDKNYPLHALIGKLVKYYKEHDLFKSDFSEQSLKMSISLFERFNSVRNNSSYAHDNDVLDKDEATYVVMIMCASLEFIHSIEKKDCQYRR